MLLALAVTLRTQRKDKKRYFPLRSLRLGEKNRLQANL